ncbi:MAG TPA: hypothetical protein VEF04_15590, partial [Blastocatellia bacterium]|nr:hypothetical protein [Blastocatellia bacterium]
ICGTINLYHELMELPVFQDNLKSSGGWAPVLNQAREEWSVANARLDLQSRALVHQAEQTVLRAQQRGIEIKQANFFAAAQYVFALSREPEARLTLDALLKINCTIAGTTEGINVWRQGDVAQINQAHEPPPAIIVQRLLENALDWFSMPSVTEMNPVEQAALVYLRLLDISPFEFAQEPTALLAASFYTERAGLPPIIIPADDATIQNYQTALGSAFRMLTQPLVEFFANCLIKTMRLTLAERTQ